MLFWSDNQLHTTACNHIELANLYRLPHHHLQFLSSWEKAKASLSPTRAWKCHYVPTKGWVRVVGENTWEENRCNSETVANRTCQSIPDLSNSSTLIVRLSLSKYKARHQCGAHLHGHLHEPLPLAEVKLDLIGLGSHHHLGDATRHQDWSLAATRPTQDLLQGRAGRSHSSNLKKAFAKERKQECALTVFTMFTWSYPLATIGNLLTWRVQILVIMPGKRLESPHESEAKAVCLKNE